MSASAMHLSAAVPCTPNRLRLHRITVSPSVVALVFAAFLSKRVSAAESTIEAAAPPDAHATQVACADLEQTYRAAPTYESSLNLGMCLEKQSKAASARQSYLEAARLAETKREKAHVEEAKNRAAAIEAKLNYLIIEVPAPPDGLTVHRDGLLVEPTAWGRPAPADPGFHTLTVEAPGFDRTELRIMVRADIPTTTFRLPALRDAGAQVADTTEPAPALPAAGSASDREQPPASAAPSASGPTVSAPAASSGDIPADSGVAKTARRRRDSGLVFLPRLGFMLNGSNSVEYAEECSGAVPCGESSEGESDDTSTFMLALDLLGHAVPEFRLGGGLILLPSVKEKFEGSDESSGVGTELAGNAIVEGVIDASSSVALAGRGFVGLGMLFPGGEFSDALNAAKNDCSSAEAPPICEVKGGPFVGWDWGLGAGAIIPVSASGIGLRFGLLFQQFRVQGWKKTEGVAGTATTTETENYTTTRFWLNAGVEL